MARKASSSSSSSSAPSPPPPPPPTPSTSFLDNPLYKHITGLDTYEYSGGGGNNVKLVKRNESLVGSSSSLREGAAHLAALIKGGHLAGRLALITGDASTGKTAHAVAIARHLATLEVPAVAMHYREVFKPRNDPGNSNSPGLGQQLTGQPTDLFTDNLRRAVAVVHSPKKAPVTLFQVNADKALAKAIDIDAVARHAQDRLIRGVLFIGGGLAVGCSPELADQAALVDYFRHLKAALENVCGLGGVFAPAIVVLAQYGPEDYGFSFVEEEGGEEKVGSVPLPLPLGRTLPLGFTSDLVYCSLHTQPYSPKEVDQIFELVGQQALDVKIGEPVLRILKQIALTAGRKAAHAILLEAVQFVKKDDDFLPVLSTVHYQAGLRQFTDEMKRQIIGTLRKVDNSCSSSCSCSSAHLAGEQLARLSLDGGGGGGGS